MAVVKIFAYRGAVGAVSDMTSPNILNEPPVDNAVQVNAADVVITAEAKALLTGAPNSNEVPPQVTFDSGTVTLKGIGFHVFIGNNLTVNTGSDLSILAGLIEDETISVPFGFKMLVRNS